MGIMVKNKSHSYYISPLREEVLVNLDLDLQYCEHVFILV
jgi:hypothetical protein